MHRRSRDRARPLGSLRPPCAALALAALFSACADGAPPPAVLAPAVSTPAPVPAGAAVSPPFDVKAALAGVRRRFHPEAGGWSGGFGPYSAHVTADAIAIAPVAATPAPAVDDADDELDHRRPVIRVRASGLRPAGKTAGGDHFVDPATGLGVRYGVATWIDARGERTAVAVEQAPFAAELALRVPARVLEGSAYPAVLDPLVSPEVDVDEPVFTASALRYEVAPAVAWNGSSYLIAWEDHRLSFHSKSQVWVALVAPDGALLSPPGVKLSGDEADPVHVDVAAAGGSFLVAWETGADPAGGHGVVGVRVSGGGAALDAAPIAIASAPGDQAEPTIVSSGAGYFVAWQDLRNGSSNDIYGAFLDGARRPQLRRGQLPRGVGRRRGSGRRAREPGRGRARRAAPRDQRGPRRPAPARDRVRRRRFPCDVARHPER